MNDARKRKAFFSWISSLKSSKLMQEGYIITGVVLFIAVIIVSNNLIRILLLVGVGIVALLVARLRKGHQHNNVSEDENKNNDHQEINCTVKKLLFDDLQPSGSQYKIQFVEDNSTDLPKKGDEQPTNLPQQQRTPRQTLVDWDTKAFFEDIELLEHGGPRAEFNSLTSRILSVMKEVNFAHTVALFWVNREKHQLVLENAITDSNVFRQQRRFEIGTDYISQVALSGKPLIVNYLAEATLPEVLPYYTQQEQVQTFIGIPVFYPTKTTSQKESIAVLTADCFENDAYGNETIALLAHFAKLFSSLLVSYTSKYDLLMDSETLQALSRFRVQIEQDFTIPVIARSLAEELSKLVSWDYIAIVLHDDSRKEWIVQHLLNRMNDPYVSLLSVVDLQNSIVGKAIQSGAAFIHDSIAILHQPRFYPAERCEGNGSIMIFPLNSLSRCYGAVVVESKDRRAFGETDLTITKKLAETASWALEIMSLTEITTKYLTLDETTGVATRNAFMARLQEEVQRANDFNAELAVVLLSIDKMEDHLQRHGKEAFDFVLQNVGRIIKNAVRPYDIVGRYDFNCFGVVLISTTANEASLWSEKIRKNIASNIINIDGKNFSVTVSIGIAGAINNISDVELLDNANRALSKAREAGGNILRVY